VKIKTNTFRKAKILPEALVVGKEFWSGTFAPRDLGVLRKDAVPDKMLSPFGRGSG